MGMDWRCRKHKILQACSQVAVGLGGVAVINLRQMQMRIGTSYLLLTPGLEKKGRDGKVFRFLVGNETFFSEP